MIPLDITNVCGDGVIISDDKTGANDDTVFVGGDTYFVHGDSDGVNVDFTADKFCIGVDNDGTDETVKLLMLVMVFLALVPDFKGVQCWHE